MPKHWAYESVFYHIYPLGLTGAPLQNDLHSTPVARLKQLYAWIEHLLALNVNALYLGPVFESSTHGYDTVDYYRVDRRLGDWQMVAELVSVLHDNGIRVILDAVLNHVGRDFWAFRDVLAHGRDSAYCDWFRGLTFGAKSAYGDPFTYEGWHGHYDLVKLDVRHKAARDYLLEAVTTWMVDFDIDGLRLDAADCLDFDFLKDLSRCCRRQKPDFWLVGEVVHGDYRRWANGDMLDSVTNYECYKGLYSSHVDGNYFEIAYALNRQFGADGRYRHLPLYNFADNHDVNRVASNLTNPAHLLPLYCLLFTMPGVPSIYYGSEWGIEGKKRAGSDDALRPAIDLETIAQSSPRPELAGFLGQLAGIRRSSPALKYGSYRELLVKSRQLAFARQTDGDVVLVLLNAADSPVSFELVVPELGSGPVIDRLDGETQFSAKDGEIVVKRVAPNSARILQRG